MAPRSSDGFVRQGRVRDGHGAGEDRGRRGHSRSCLAVSGQDRDWRHRRSHCTVAAGGLEQEVESWLGPGPNLPVSPEQLRSALGESVVDQIVAVTGIPTEKLLVLIAGYLPSAVDAMSPNGTIEENTPPA
ncbi:MAG: YidB family protein [Rhodoplanes sp.]